MEYLNRPYELGNQGPDAYDCWSLVRAVLRDRYGLDVPVIGVQDSEVRTLVRAFRDSGERSAWRRIEEPSDGDVVLMSHSRHPHHVGIWLDVDGGGVLHALEGSGVIFSRDLALRMQGWSKQDFYRHESRF